ncbi:MAG: hypothetical protein LBK56_05895 [Gracilibacteraceae bacterium]|jgi:hypothetical protein|nr:hypothetical protein [Gracilibacteraceae bacterium]
MQAQSEKRPEMTVENRPEVPEMISIRQAAKRGVLPERALRRFVATGQIPTVRSGRTAYINYDLLLEQLQSGVGAIWHQHR